MKGNHVYKTAQHLTQSNRSVSSVGYYYFSLMLLLHTLKILSLNLLHRNNFRDCHFYSSFLWLLKCVLINNIHLELHIFKIFLAVWKLRVTTYLSFCNLQFGSFKPSQSDFKPEASSFVSLNSSSVSHWLVLRTVTSNQPTRSRRDKASVRPSESRRMTSLSYSRSPLTQAETDKNGMNTDYKFPCDHLPQCLWDAVWLF